MNRPLPYLMALPLPEGPTRARLDALQKAVAAGINPTPGQIAKCWADAADGDVGQARDYLSGRRPWPTVGRKRGKLIQAVEAWEAKHLSPLLTGKRRMSDEMKKRFTALQPAQVEQQ